MLDLATVSKNVNEIQRSIDAHLTEAVKGAIEIGSILARAKSDIDHGDFMKWIDKNCNFAHSTALRYIKIFEYKDELQNRHALKNLQDAYRQVETLESQERRTEDQKARDRVKVYLKTGEKPEGWRRGTDDKIAQEEADRDDRLEAVKSKMAEAEKVKAETRQQREADHEAWEHSSAMLESVSKAISEKLEQRARFKERIRVSQSGESDQFIEALMDYLDELENDNRRIEACQNIIKVCRNIAAELQVQ